MAALEQKSSHKINPSNVKFGFIIGILFLPILIYYSGLNGPFIFDDIPNIVLNKNIQKTEISISTLNEAAHSLDSGMLGRSIAGISFAINYYLANGAENTFGYKLFNVIIHIVNGLLVFWFLSLLLTTFFKAAKHSTYLSNSTIIAGTCALIWLVHPIQVSSVLYVVQRMTSMAALFILLSLIFYIYARLAIGNNKPKESFTYFSLSIFSGVLGALCKETALLLPFYIIIVEFLLFKDQKPFAYWKDFSIKTKVLFSGLAVVALMLGSIATVFYSLPGYINRDFDLIERLLTESRVLLLYISQLLIPRISSYGLYHDDITISTSLFSPWTTLFSIIIIISLVYVCIRYATKLPLVAFGILWFFVSHILESTVYPLELIHEHRNYLASLGPILIVISSIFFFGQNSKRLIGISCIFIIISLAGMTSVRSSQWSSLSTLLEAETFYRPESARAWADLFGEQTKANMPEKAIASILKAIQLRPNEPGYSLALYLYTKSFNQNLASFANNKTIENITLNPESSIFLNILHRIHKCLDSSCNEMRNDFGNWTAHALKYSSLPRLKYYHAVNLYAQDEFELSLKYLNESIQEGQYRHASPLIKRIEVLLALRKFSEADTAFDELKELNRAHLYVSAKYIDEIRQIINDSKIVNSTNNIIK